MAMQGEQSKKKLMAALKLTGRDNFEKLSKIGEQAFSMKVMEFSVLTSRQHGATDQVYIKNLIFILILKLTFLYFQLINQS
jgi:hypothetical protein